MDWLGIVDMLTGAGGTIDRIHTVGLVIDGVRAREEAGRGDEGLYRGLVAVLQVVQEIREDVQAVADFLGAAGRGASGSAVDRSEP